MLKSVSSEKTLHLKKDAMLANRKLILLIPALLMIINCITWPAQGHSQCRPAIRKAVRAQLAQYPVSTLQDIYKSFFQDEFGPGHLVTDIQGSLTYFQQEINEMTSRGHYLPEPCGTGRNFIRVPLDLVKDGKIPSDEYFSAFVESAKKFKIPETERWRKKWARTAKVIASMGLSIAGFESDRIMLDEMLERGEYVIHHSEAYLNAYDPHYRIISRKEWERVWD
jgi:hypothetical protein